MLDHATVRIELNRLNRIICAHTFLMMKRYTKKTVLTCDRIIRLTAMSLVERSEGNVAFNRTYVILTPDRSCVRVYKNVCHDAHNPTFRRLNKKKKKNGVVDCQEFFHKCVVGSVVT